MEQINPSPGGRVTHPLLPILPTTTLQTFPKHRPFSPPKHPKPEEYQEIGHCGHPPEYSPSHSFQITSTPAARGRA